MLMQSSTKRMVIMKMSVTTKQRPRSTATVTLRKAGDNCLRLTVPFAEVAGLDLIPGDVVQWARWDDGTVELRLQKVAAR
jgi:hypothetical protein